MVEEASQTNNQTFKPISFITCPTHCNNSPLLGSVNKNKDSTNPLPRAEHTGYFSYHLTVGRPVHIPIPPQSLDWGVNFIDIQSYGWVSNGEWTDLNDTCHINIVNGCAFHYVYGCNNGCLGERKALVGTITCIMVTTWTSILYSANLTVIPGTLGGGLALWWGSSINLV